MIHAHAHQKRRPLDDCDYPGDLLLSVSFTSPLTCLALDPAETVAWVGDQSGGIHRLDLLSPPRDVSVTR